jgi:hypothetical protein
VCPLIFNSNKVYFASSLIAKPTVGAAEKKNPNCHKYATFEGSLSSYFYRQKKSNLFKNIAASALIALR